MEEAPWASWIAKLLTCLAKRLSQASHILPPMMRSASVMVKAQSEKHNMAQVDFLTDNQISFTQVDRIVGLEIKV